MQATSRWAATTAELRIADIGDGLFALFNPLSWQTHIVDAASLALLELLQSRPSTLDELEEASRQDAEAQPGPPAEDKRQWLLTALRQLESIDLVERRGKAPMPG